MRPRWAICHPRLGLISGDWRAAVARTAVTELQCEGIPVAGDGGSECAHDLSVLFAGSLDLVIIYHVDGQGERAVDEASFLCERQTGSRED